MAVLVNRARMSTSTNTNGTITLDSAETGYQTFAAAGVSDGDSVRYVIEDGNAWEIGTGTYTATGTTLSRSPSESSSGGSAITLSGSASVFISATSDDVVTPTSTTTLTNKTLTSPALTTPAISTPTMTGTIVEDVYALSGTTPSLEPDNGSVQTHTLTGNTTYSDGFTAGEAITLMIDDGTAYTVTWPTMTWVNNAGSAPTLATSGYTVIALWKVSTTLYGALVGDGT